MSRRSLAMDRRYETLGSVSPTSYDNLALWLRSDQGLTIVGGKVSQWNDMSGNGANVTQATAGNRPTYSYNDTNFANYPSVGFVAASSTQLNNSQTLVQPCTVYCVCNTASTPAGNVAVFDSSGALLMGTNASLQAIYYAGGAAVLHSTPAEFVAGTPVAMCGVFNGASSHLYINNSQSAVANGNPGTNGTSGAINLGGVTNSYWDGSVAEYIVFSVAHSTSTIQEIYAYLGSRYGITVS